MIVRNEAGNLPRTLASIKSVVDRIVVVDTGSSDESIHLARKAICNPRSLGYLVVRHDLETDSPNAAYTQMWQLRLFRNRSDLRFRGRCHPDFQPSLFEVAKNENLHVRESSIILKHWGYTAEQKPAKLIRARKLLEAELLDRPGQLYYEVEYVRTLMATGEKKAAASALESVMQRTGDRLADPVCPHPSIALLLEIVLQLPDSALSPPWTGERVTAAAARWFPKAPPLIWLRAQAAFSRQDYATAAGLLRLLVKMGRSEDYDRSCSFDPRIIHQDAEVNLGVCLVHQGEIATAKKHFRRLAKSGGESVEAARANLRLLS